MQKRMLVFGMFVILTAWKDLRYRQIDLWIFAVFGIMAGIMVWNPCVWFGTVNRLECLAGGLFGVLLLWLGKTMRGTIGDGDGLFFGISGIMLGLRSCLLIFTEAIWLCGIYGLFYMVYGKFRNHLYVGKEKLPFLSFAAAAWILMIWESGIEWME